MGIFDGLFGGGSSGSSSDSSSSSGGSSFYRSTSSTSSQTDDSDDDSGSSSTSTDSDDSSTDSSSSSSSSSSSTSDVFDSVTSGSSASDLGDDPTDIDDSGGSPSPSGPQQSGGNQENEPLDTGSSKTNETDIDDSGGSPSPSGPQQSGGNQENEPLDTGSSKTNETETDEPLVKPNAKVNPENAVKKKVQKKTEAELKQGDVDVTQEGDQLKAELTDSGRQREQKALQGQLLTEQANQGANIDALAAETRGEPNSGNRRQGDIFSGAVSTFEDVTGTDVPGEGSVVRNARRNQAGQTGEQFGDIAVRVPEGSGEAIAAGVGNNLLPGSGAGATADLVGAGVSTVEGRRTEDIARDVRDELDENIINPAAEFAGDNNEIARQQVFDSRIQQAGAQAGLTAFNRVADTGKQNPSDQLIEDAVRGGGQLANPGALTVTGKEATEFGVEAVTETAEGDGGEFAKDAADATAVVAADVTRFGVNNPNRLAGQVAGSAAATFGVLGAGRAIGGAAGTRAASATVQPGEELAIAAARRGVPGTRRLASVVGDDVDLNSRRGQSLLDDDRGQADLTGPSRSETNSGSDEAIVIDGEQVELADAPGPSRPPELRNDVDAGTRARQQRRDRFEEGGQTDAERFQAGRGDTMMERRAQRRRQERELSDQDLREQAEAREVTTPDSLRKQAEDLGVRSLRATEAEVQQDAKAVQEDASRARAASRIDLNVGLRPKSGIVSRTDIRQDIRSDTRTELRSETRQESRLETRSESRAESRSESRAETRAEVRFEQRAESDVDREIRQRFDDVEERRDEDRFDKELRNPVTRPGNVAENTESLIDDATEQIDLDLEDS